MSHSHHPPAADVDSAQATARAADRFAATYVVDTNVILVANGQHADVGASCSHRCAMWLEGLMQAGRISLDADFHILREYQHKTQAANGPGRGDAFVRWVLHHVDDPTRCDLVRLAPDAERGYASFPADSRLAAFDRADRKFVAVARAHPESPPILQATDCKWLDWSSPLADHGVRVRFLCEDDVRQFHLHKFGT